MSTTSAENNELARELAFAAHIESLDEIRGDARATVDAIDAYCWAGQWMMNVGDEKGQIVDAAVAEAAPDVIIELGMYCGYSALRFASRTPATTKIFSIEPHAGRAAVAKRVFAHAGVSDRIVWLEGTASDVFPSLLNKIRVELGLDSDASPGKLLFFFDHVKGAYKPDLMLGESLGLFPEGAVVVADNVIFPGAPDFLEYVRASDKWSTTFHASHLEYSKDEDGIEVCIRVAA
ncbi:catechol O-methyltransferase [Thecamonas trahens ATCC 50062]|uniref:catechol O-methyltransferase n=1 Tax=Thecamonas trahens ATCC 50062 TaxID=461836 RepID=A0A0L0D344_THETB|nr:catechol O-methyltransferase [Thecamonas trahens ATCC 50062]KNC46767.1 catechol O-methyltransferase [Thecamonas trahens ATCC 50062]|eukprot:XP_013760045.1 catechol O-methyltransferase [Thecamonas trahens ATCC 50062]